MPAREATLKPEAGATAVSASLGTEQPVVCIVYDRPIDPGGAIAKIIGATGQKVQYERLAPDDVVPLKDWAVVFVDSLYTADSPNGRALGELKLAVFASEVAPVLCMHDELGYRETFKRTSLSFIESLQASGAAAMPAPVYTELHLAKLNDKPIGYNKRSIFTEGNKRYARLWSALLLPRGPSDLQLNDSETYLEFDADLRLIKGVWVKATGGELVTRLRVEREPGGSYRYEGTHDGHDIRGQVQPRDKRGIPSELRVAQDLKALVAGPRERLEIEEYHPTIDPTALVQVQYEKSAAAPNQIQVKLGQSAMSTVVDERGLFREIAIQVGPATLRSVRVTEQGQL